MVLPRRPFLCGLLLAALASAFTATAGTQTRPAVLLRFESDTQLQALAADGPTVLFFFATWCPNCQAAARDFSDRWAEVRPGIALVVADFDKQTALKARYGVTYQDTYVQVGPDGKRLRIWNGGSIAALNANAAP